MKKIILLSVAIMSFGMFAQDGLEHRLNAEHRAKLEKSGQARMSKVSEVRVTDNCRDTGWRQRVETVSFSQGGKIHHARFGSSYSDCEEFEKFLDNHSRLSLNQIEAKKDQIDSARQAIRAKAAQERAQERAWERATEKFPRGPKY